MLFPGALLPLHVFEPRYRAMTRHCLATHRALAVVALARGEEPDERGQPAIHRIAGAGTIVEHEDLPDGRINILLRGEARVVLEELSFVPPFRRAAARILVDEGDPANKEDVSALIAIATAFAGEVRAQNPSFDVRIPSTLPADRAADVIAHTLVVDPRVRQELLETRDPRIRTQKTLEAIDAQRTAVRGGGRVPTNLRQGRGEMIPTRATIALTLVVTAGCSETRSTPPPQTSAGSTATTVPVASAPPPASGVRPDEHGMPEPLSTPTLTRVCSTAPCAGPMSLIDVWRTRTGRVALYVHQGDISRCSHPPTVYFDALGKEVLTQAQRPVAPGSADAKRFADEREAVTRDLVKAESPPCPR